MKDQSWTVDDGAPGGWPAERACQYGDGLFETLAIVDGQPCLWKLHLDRLLRGCDRLSLPRPEITGLAQACRHACDNVGHTGLKLYWTAGRSERGYRRPLPLRPRGQLQRFPWQPPVSPAPWSVRLCTHRLSDNPVLAGIKHLNRLDQVVARAEWNDEGIAEGVMLGQNGEVVCGTMSNLFIERDGQLVTPSIDRSGVAGVVRRLLLDEASRRDSPIRIERLQVADLLAADAFYLTNALIGVRRVARFSGSEFDLERREHPLMAWARETVHRPEVA